MGVASGFNCQCFARSGAKYLGFGQLATAQHDFADVLDCGGFVDRGVAANRGDVDAVFWFDFLFQRPYFILFYHQYHGAVRAAQPFGPLPDVGHGERIVFAPYQGIVKLD